MDSQASTMPPVRAAQKKKGPVDEGFSQRKMMVSSQIGGAAPRSSAQPLAPASATTARRSSLPFVAVGIMLLLLVLGAGGYAVIHFMGSKANGNAAATDPAKGVNGVGWGDLAAGGHG